MENSNQDSAAFEADLKFTQADLAELECARNMPIVFDEDCPETTPERAIKFRRVNPPRAGRAMG